MKNLDAWMQVYAEKLREAIRQNPEDYAYPLNEAEFAIHRMRGAFERGSYNKDTPAIKATCKEFRIPHTYKAIAKFLNGTQTEDKL